jgi:hypothetical protein
LWEFFCFDLLINLEVLKTGPNSLMIKLLTKDNVPKGFNLKEDSVKDLIAKNAANPDATFSSELANSRLFIVDYSILDQLPPTPGTFLPAPIAIFQVIHPSTHTFNFLFCFLPPI